MKTFTLSEDVIEAITESWAEVRKHPKQNGVDFYFTFFTYFPQYKELFDDFRSVPLDEIRCHPKLRMHGVRVIYALSSMVDSLDELEITREIMRKTVDNHYPRGVRQKDLENLFSLLPIYLEAKAGDKFGTEARKGWETVVQILLDVSAIRLEELDGSQS